MASIISSNSGLTQASVAAGVSLAVALIWLFAPLPYTPVLIPLAFAGLVFAAYRPLEVCTAFVALSMFRLPDVAPPLERVHLPLLLAALTIFSLIWNACSQSFVPFWSAGLKLLAVFFAIVTVGVVFAINPGLAFLVWSQAYWKIFGMALALAWLTRTAEDFQLIARVIAVSGLTIAAVAIHNKLTGIGLVEGTRVTIGRDSGSILGDPNILALILLTPLCFSLAMAISRLGVLDRAVGLLSFPPTLLAVIYTQSRGAIFGVVASGVIFGMKFVKSKILLAGFGVIAAAGLYSAMDVEDRASGGAAETGLDESAQARLDAWSVALRATVSHPLTGVGLSNFSLFNGFLTGHFLEAHNTWLEILVDTGVPGFVVFVAMLGTTFMSSRRCARQMRETNGPPAVQAVALGVLASLAGFCAAGSFLSEGFAWPIYVIVALNAAVVHFVSDGWAPEPSSPTQDSGPVKP